MKKKLFIAIGVCLLIIVIGAALGYLFYLNPRLHVRSATAGITPLVQQDASVAKELEPHSRSWQIITTR